ncbi:MAG TPA: MFS transporter [Streptosporangiaceae bacterium]|nr:MFS transporter [Streptosporangiaceae bacterium]
MPAALEAMFGPARDTPEHHPAPVNGSASATRPTRDLPSPRDRAPVPPDRSAYQAAPDRFAYQPEPGDAAFRPEPGYAPGPGYAPESGYGPEPDYGPEPGDPYPPEPGYAPGPGYPPEPGYPDGPHYAPPAGNPAPAGNPPPAGHPPISSYAAPEYPLGPGLPSPHPDAAGPHQGAEDDGEPQQGRHRRAPETQATYREVFAIREFRGLWVAQVLSYAGDQFAQVAIAILVYHRTGSALLTALAYALTYLPPIAGGPLLSGLADLFPRRRVMIICDLVRAGLVALMAIPSLPFGGLCGLLFFTVLLGAPFSSARSALLPDVLPGDKFVVGSAIGNITFQASQILGFVAGAAVVTVLNPYRTLATDAVTFAISALIVTFWVKRRPSPHREPGKMPSLWAVSRDGVTMVFGNPILRTLLLFGWVAGFYIVPEGLAAPYAHSLHGSTLTVGLLMAAMPLGTVIGAFTFGRLVAPSARVRMMGWLAMASCAPLIGSAFNPPLWVVLTLFALAGMASAYQLAAAAAFVQSLDPSGRARAFGLAQSGLLAVQGLGIMAGGAVANAIGAPMAVGLAGLIGLCAAAILAMNWTIRRGDVIEAMRARSAASGD